MFSEVGQDVLLEASYLFVCHAQLIDAVHVAQHVTLFADHGQLVLFTFSLFRCHLWSTSSQLFQALLLHPCIVLLKQIIDASFTTEEIFCLLSQLLSMVVLVLLAVAELLSQ